MEQLHGDADAASAIYAEATQLFSKNMQLLVTWAKLEADSGNDLKVYENRYTHSLVFLLMMSFTLQCADALTKTIADVSP